MAEFKNRKLLINVREFIKEGTMYNINGIDLSKAIFFWRLPQDMYDVIPFGFYEIVYEGDNIYLRILDVETYGKIESIQICYEFASMSSPYDVDFNVDVNILKDRYNEVVEDVKAIFNYVEKNMMTSDALDVSVVLPQLNTGEVWMKVEGGYKGFNVGEIEKNIEEFWKRFEEAVKLVFEAIELAGTVQVDRINATASPIDDKLDKIWRMYSVLTGSQRYLSGGVLSLREVNKLEKEVNGGKISEREGNPKRIYNGGSLINRNQTLKGFDIDLGEYVGGAK